MFIQQSDPRAFLVRGSAERLSRVGMTAIGTVRMSITVNFLAVMVALMIATRPDSEKGNSQCNMCGAFQA